MSDQETIKFHYIKSSQFREFYASGAYGGPTPTGGFWFTLYAERSPVPTEAENQILRLDGHPAAFVLGDEINSKRRDGLIRMLEAGVHMDIEGLRRLHEWLGNHLATLEQMR